MQWLLDRTSINEPNQQLFIRVLQAALHLQQTSGLELFCQQPAAARLSLINVLGMLHLEMHQQLEQERSNSRVQHCSSSRGSTHWQQRPGS